MTGRTFLLALAQGLGQAALVAGASMALHLDSVWPGTLVAFALPLLAASFVCTIRRAGGKR